MATLAGMLKPIPLPTYETAEARQWVAQALGLPYADYMQDWPWEVATPEGFADYLALYPQAGAAERVVLMEMLLDAATWLPKEGQLRTAWAQIAVLLDQNPDLHATTAQYWCLWNYNEQDLHEHGFPIAPYVRDWWQANYPIPTDTSN